MNNFDDIVGDLVALNSTNAVVNLDDALDLFLDSGNSSNVNENEYLDSLLQDLDMREEDIQEMVAYIGSQSNDMTRKIPEKRIDRREKRISKEGFEKKNQRRERRTSKEGFTQESNRPSIDSRFTTRPQNKNGRVCSTSFHCSTTFDSFLKKHIKDGVFKINPSFFQKIVDCHQEPLWRAADIFSDDISSLSVANSQNPERKSCRNISNNPNKIKILSFDLKKRFSEDGMTVVLPRERITYLNSRTGNSLALQKGDSIEFEFPPNTLSILNESDFQTLQFKADDRYSGKLNRTPIGVKFTINSTSMLTDFHQYISCSILAHPITFCAYNGECYLIIPEKINHIQKAILHIRLTQLEFNSETVVAESCYILTSFGRKSTKNEDPFPNSLFYTEIPFDGSYRISINVEIAPPLLKSPVTMLEPAQSTRTGGEKHFTKNHRAKSVFGTENYSKNLPQNSDANSLTQKNLKFKIFSKKIYPSVSTNYTYVTHVQLLDAVKSVKKEFPNSCVVNSYIEFNTNRLWFKVDDEGEEDINQLNNLRTSIFTVSKHYKDRIFVIEQESCPVSVDCKILCLLKDPKSDLNESIEYYRVVDDIRSKKLLVFENLFETTVIPASHVLLRVRDIQFPRREILSSHFYHPSSGYTYHFNILKNNVEHEKINTENKVYLNLQKPPCNLIYFAKDPQTNCNRYFTFGEIETELNEELLCQIVCLENKDSTEVFSSQSVCILNSQQTSVKKEIYDDKFEQILKLRKLKSDLLRKQIADDLSMNLVTESSSNLAALLARMHSLYYDIQRDAKILKQKFKIKVLKTSVLDAKNPMGVLKYLSKQTSHLNERELKQVLSIEDSIHDLKKDEDTARIEAVTLSLEKYSNLIMELSDLIYSVKKGGDIKKFREFAKTTPVIICGMHSKPHFIKDLYAAKFFPRYPLLTAGEENDNNVLRYYFSIMDGLSFSLKYEEPSTMFGVQLMTNAFTELFTKGNSVHSSHPVELVKVINTEGTTKVYSVQYDFCPYDLDLLLQNDPNAISKIDMTSFSTFLFLSMIIEISDGFAQNFQVEYQNDKVVIKRYQNGEAFVGVNEELDGSISRIPMLRNILLFFPQMEENVDEKFREDFLKINPEILIGRWLTLMHLVNCEVHQAQEEYCFSESDFYYQRDQQVSKTSLSKYNLPIRFIPSGQDYDGTVRSIYKRFQKLQNFLQDNQTISHSEVISHIFPTIAKKIQEVKIHLISTIPDYNYFFCNYHTFGYLRDENLANQFPLNKTDNEIMANFLRDCVEVTRKNCPIVTIMPRSMSVKDSFISLLRTIDYNQYCGAPSKVLLAVIKQCYRLIVMNNHRALDATEIQDKLPSTLLHYGVEHYIFPFVKFICENSLVHLLKKNSRGLNVFDILNIEIQRQRDMLSNREKFRAVRRLTNGSPPLPKESVEHEEEPPSEAERMLDLLHRYEGKYSKIAPKNTRSSFHYIHTFVKSFADQPVLRIRAAIDN